MLTFLAFLVTATPPPTAAPVKVVTTLSTYAAIAREITGDRASVTSIAVGNENPHYVQPKPSFVPTLSSADLFVTTGLDLELWVPALLGSVAFVQLRRTLQREVQPARICRPLAAPIQSAGMTAASAA